MGQHRMSIVGTGSADHLLAGEHRVRLGHRTLPVDPLRLDVIEPWALRRQPADHDPHPAVLPHLPVVPADPGADPLASVPGGIVPDEQERLLPLGGQHLANPGEKRLGDLADGTPLHEAQQQLSGVATQQAIAGQRFRFSLLQPITLVQQPDDLFLDAPSRAVRIMEAAPPALVAKAQHPFRMARRPANQPIPCPFFRAYSGSGLVIQRLARFQPTFRRFIASRIVSSETRRVVIPWSAATFATFASVQRLVSKPNWRGRWWISSFSGSSAASGSTLDPWGGEGFFSWRAARPSWWKAWMALRTLWSEIPVISWMRRGVYPLALLSRAWQRRMVKALREARPRSRARRSSGHSGLTNSGGFMHPF